MRILLGLLLLTLLARTCDAFVCLPACCCCHRRNSRLQAANEYDQWMSDGVARLSFPLTEENVEECLELLMDSECGEQMFGRHEKASSIGITGSVSLVEIEGPEVTLRLDGEFWHKRNTVLGKAAIWLNACMPEIMHVGVEDQSQLEDFEDYRDEDTGELLYVHDKRSPDYNGDRGTMEYQGIDPDFRGPFPSGTRGFNINPA
eukprot:scaffold2510_cov169-Amphora_coffeaeformis.AAC.58